MATTKKATATTTAKTATTAKKTPAKKSNGVSFEQIQAKAFEIYLATGNTNAQENWLKAEKQLVK